MAAKNRSSTRTVPHEDEVANAPAAARHLLRALYPLIDHGDASRDGEVLAYTDDALTFEMVERAHDHGYHVAHAHERSDEYSESGLMVSLQLTE